MIEYLPASLKCSNFVSVCVPQGIVWGRAFLITGESALKYLAERECKIGGYKTVFAPVYTLRPSQDPHPEEEPWTSEGRVLTSESIISVESSDEKNAVNIVESIEFTSNESTKTSDPYSSTC